MSSSNSGNKPHYDADSKGIVPMDGGFTFSPRALNIIWGNDNRYWRLPSEANNCAELVQVSWLEVTGSTKVDAGKYEVGFNITMTQDAFGWNGCQVYVMAKQGRRGRYVWKKTTLDKIPQKTAVDIPQEQKLTIEVKAAEDQTLYFGLYEVWSGKWKGGLQINQAFIKKST